MGTLVPGQNFDHLLIVISGWDGMHDLQYAAKFADAETFNRGALISLDSNGEYVAGLSTNAAMPLWAINATDDFDVNSDVGNVSATGIVGAYVATGGYELRTTEFDTSGTYTPNTQLEPGSVAGEIVNKASDWGLSAAGPCVGIVTNGVNTENYDQSTVGFWPVFLPELFNVVS